MRAYKVAVADKGRVLAVRYASTQADAKDKRDELMAEYNLKKSDVLIEEVEISLAKLELLGFINELAAKFDSV